MKKTIIASLIALAATPISAEEVIELDDVTVKANRFERKDIEATYASEIHTNTQIEASGASTLFDYLVQQSSLNLGSNFGNKATPSINLRGYGQNGFQNVVITLDGQRLNNIDLSPQLLAGIPLGNIDRIEISKGSGSVVYGDGATAGAIQIYTKAKTGVSVSSAWGNYGQKNHYITAGISEEYIDLSANLAHESHDGFSDDDVTGHHDLLTSNTQNVKLKLKPTDDLRLIAEGTNSRNEIRYVGPLSKAAFGDDPKQNGGNAYTRQSLDTDQWKIGGEYDINDHVSLSYTHFREDKTSAFPTFVADYDYQSNDVAIRFESELFSALIGYQGFDGERTTALNSTSKKNNAIFVNTEYRPAWITDKLILSAGLRKDKVRYEFKPTSGTSLYDSEILHAWDIGANYQFNDNLSVFTNFNKSFQAPDIDRFFGFDAFFNTVFNGFIKPQRVETYNIGFNHVLANNRLKVTAFSAQLNNEIYLDPTQGFFGTNSNLDSTRKYGVEIQDSFKFNNQLSASFIYNYIRAIVKKEDTIAGQPVRNKDLPGAPKHTFVANVNWQFLDNAHLNLNHTWRSKAYAFNDFQNNLDQKQDAYQTTNLAINYAYKNFSFFAAVNNIFEEENSIQVRDDVIYPVDFVRTWRIGMKADF